MTMLELLHIQRAAAEEAIRDFDLLIAAETNAGMLSYCVARRRLFARRAYRLDAQIRKMEAGL